MDNATALQNMKDAGIPFISADTNTLSQINGDSSAADIQQALGMAKPAEPSGMREFKDATHVVIEFPGSKVSLVYKPVFDEFEIMLMDRNGKPMAAEGISGSDGVSRVFTEEVADTLSAVNNMQINKPRKDFSPPR